MFLRHLRHGREGKTRERFIPKEWLQVLRVLENIPRNETMVRKLITIRTSENPVEKVEENPEQKECSSE